MTKTEQLLNALPEGTPVVPIRVAPIAEEDRKDLARPMRLYAGGKEEGGASYED